MIFYLFVYYENALYTGTGVRYPSHTLIIHFQTKKI